MTNNGNEIRGRVVAVTGGARGIGRAAGEAFLRAGAADAVDKVVGSLRAAEPMWAALPVNERARWLLAFGVPTPRCCESTSPARWTEAPGDGSVCRAATRCARLRRASDRR